MIGVVLASEGYPVAYEKGFLIKGLEKFENNDGYYCFHAGTKKTEEGFVTNGGRVLGVTAVAQNLETAIKNAYELTDKVGFENGFCRRDIGQKALNAEVK